MFQMKMKVRSIIDNEHSPTRRQVQLYSEDPKQQPNEMVFWVDEKDMDGIRSGARLTVTVAPTVEG